MIVISFCSPFEIKDTNFIQKNPPGKIKNQMISKTTVKIVAS